MSVEDSAAHERVRYHADRKGNPTMPTDNDVVRIAEIESIRKIADRPVYHDYDDVVDKSEALDRAMRIIDELKAELDRLRAENGRLHVEIRETGKRDADTIFGLESKCAALLAELDRVTADNDYLLGVQKDQLARADNLIHERNAVRAALRAARTWTVATPETMPPPGSGPWLVEVYGRLCETYWSGFEGVGDAAAIAWCTKGGDIIRRAVATRFAAMPEEPGGEGA